VNLLSLWGLLALLLVSIPVTAESGKLSLAYPVKDIILDGDLEDWPDEAIRYPIRNREDGVPLRGRNDFKGYFHIGYNETDNALYIGVEILDDSIVRLGRDGDEWNRRDGIELYLFGHKPGQNVPTQYRIWGDDRGTYGPGSFADVQAEVRWDSAGVVYEWRIDMESASDGTVQLRPDTELGFDVGYWDRDMDGSHTWIAWSKGRDKYIRTDRLGTVVLVPEEADVAALMARLGDLSDGRQVLGRRPATGAGIPAGYQMFFSGVLMAITFLHFLLFMFNRDTHANLFYALYTAVIGAAIFSGLQMDFRTYMDPRAVRAAKEFALLLINLCGLAFLYAFFRRVPKRFYVELALVFAPVAVGAVLVFAGAGITPLLGFFDLSRLLLGLANSLIFLETIVALVGGVRRQREGAWIIGGGFILFAANLSPLVYGTETDISALYWVLIPLVSMSVYLARSVGRTHQELQTRLRQVEQLSAKTQEQYEQIQEQNAQIQEANRLKSDFLARMSHDLRTPMNAIIGYTRILLRRAKGSLDERQYKNLENVQISANNLLELINDILDLSKIESGRIQLKVEEVDLGAVARECAASVESLLKPNVELRLAIDPVPLLQTDDDRVRRALMNLLGNAVKFTEAGHIEIGVHHNRGWTELRVTDTGIGIPKADLPHIFDEFRQVDEPNGARREGTGLGLAIVKKSAELLGGNVSVESEEGVGSTFTLRLKSAVRVKVGAGAAEGADGQTQSDEA
jgi:signal transduction histidine kinase